MLFIMLYIDFLWLGCLWEWTFFGRALKQIFKFFFQTLIWAEPCFGGWLSLKSGLSFIFGRTFLTIILDNLCSRSWHAFRFSGTGSVCWICFGSCAVLSWILETVFDVESPHFPEDVLFGERIYFAVLFDVFTDANHACGCCFVLVVVILIAIFVDILVTVLCVIFAVVDRPFGRCSKLAVAVLSLSSFWRAFKSSRVSLSLSLVVVVLSWRHYCVI